MSALPRRIARVARRALYLPGAVLFRALGFRLLQLTHPDRIGHLAGEPDCLLKEEALGRSPSYRGVLLAPRNRVANQHLLRYWGRHFTVVSSPWLCRLLAPVGQHRFARYRADMSGYFSAIGTTAEFNAIYSEWGDREPVLRLTEQDRRRGEAELEKLGIPAGAPFVCFHSRDAGYSPRDEHLHSYRNASIQNYLPAMRALRDFGVYGVRMGDPSMPPLPKLDGVVDYAHSPLRCDWLDVFLCARCEFVLGSSSGLYLIATIFGRPSALANLLPMSSALMGGPGQLGIPKLIWHERDQRHLTFTEVLGSPVANYRFTSDYRAHGLSTLQNEPDDIRSLAIEMWQRLQGQAQYTPADEALQERFRGLFRPGHYGFGSTSRIGRDFLRKHASLLTPDRAPAAEVTP